VSGENTQHSQQPREQRQSQQSGGPKHDNEGGNQQRNRNRRSGSGGGGGGRKGVYRFDDQLEHDICQLVTHSAPQGFPAVSRGELATMPPIEVARTETRILLCDGRHEGPHIWPNGDELPEG
jgi:hypothetical protein